MVALIEMYADESESNKVLTVAGYVFEKDSAVALHREWMPILAEKELSYFRMVDCAHGAGQFKKLSPDERNDVQFKLFDVLKAHVACGFSVSFDLAHKHLLPSSLGLNIPKVTPYALCCYWLLLNARRWTHENQPDAKIAYFFEAGDPNQSQANNIMNALFNSPWHKEHFKYVAHAFVDKQHSGAIQCADILAWQWSKDLKNRAEGRRTRADLMALLQARPHYTTEFDTEKTLAFVDLIRGQAEGISR